ncbi:MAG: S-layer homology domain-containing protein [Clostridia bacterium]|nr:S-layer homology domain-containing protein [Clostridia bacterium]
MKNFKRVISAVIALALSASTLVAVSAATTKFADVDSNNSYAEAIESLAALDIVSGYEDGSFKPDGEITRAEAARMIVSALNMNADAASSAGTTKFADVNEKASWAAGFVNVGVAQGYIHGYDDVSFGPQDNVTFAQMCVMLTTITGYGDYAAVNGGYPQGYMSMASTAGINKGVALAAETPLKRGQVAQMVYNAVTAPMLDVTAYKFDGNTYGKMDGISIEKKTLLSDKFSAVEVKASVDSFPAAGEVNVTVTDDNKYGPTAGTTVVGCADWNTYSWNNVIVDNGLDLSGYVKQEVKAIFKLDSNNKTHIVSAIATNAISTKEVESAGSYTAATLAGENWIKFGTQKENLENVVTLYVNGVQYTVGADATAPGTTGTNAYTVNLGTSNTALTKILNNAVGAIKLAKVPYTVGTVKTTPSNYNTIFIDAYQVAQVRNVEYLSGKTTVNFALCGKNNISSFESIAITDNEIANGSVKLDVQLDGKAIELKELKKNDIIAIKTEITGSNITANHKDVKILVSRDIVNGKVTDVQVEDSDNKFTVGGTDYASIDKANVKLGLNKTYNAVYLDPFGRIAAFDEEDVEESHNYAIVAKIDDNDVILVLADGTKKTYEVKDTDVYKNAKTTAGVAGLWADETIKDVKTTVVAAANQHANAAVEASVVEYTLKSGKITSLVYQAPAYIDTNITTKGEYRAEVSRLGTIGVNSSTNVIDVDKTSYKNYAGMTVSQLSDGEKYAGAAYGKITGTSVYSLVILTNAGFTYNANSRFAVLDANAWSSGLDKDGDGTVDQLKVVVNGKKTTLDVATSYKSGHSNSNDEIITGTTKYGRGDAFFYTLDNDGLVDDIRWIPKSTITGGTVTLATAFGAAGTAYDSSATKWGATDQTLPSYTGTANYRLIQGIVVGVGSNTVKMIDMPTAAGPVDVTNYASLKLADNCQIYTYNSKADVEEQDRLNATGVLVDSDFADWKIGETPGYTIGATAGTAAAGYSAANLSWIAWTTANVPTATEEDPTAATWAGSANEWANQRGIKQANVSSIKGKNTDAKAQYAMALVIDDQVVEIYEIIK